MRFPSASGRIASVTVSVTSLRDTMAFWRGVLHPLGYGRISEWPGCVLWARDGAQLLVQEQPYPSSGIVIMLRAPSRTVVDAIHATAVAEGWPIKQPPGPQYIAPGYYGCALTVPGAERITIAIAHAWDDLPARTDAATVRIAGADPDVSLGGYLFRPAAAAPSASISTAVIVLSGYGGDATGIAATGAELAQAGWTALCLSQRGWLGSTGNEDQGLRQPDDVLCAADWLAREAARGRTRAALCLRGRLFPLHGSCDLARTGGARRHPALPRRLRAAGRHCALLAAARRARHHGADAADPWRSGYPGADCSK